MKRLICLLVLVILVSVSCYSEDKSKNTWTKEDKNAYWQGCFDKNVDKIGDKKLVTNFCDCCLSKMMGHYPDVELVARGLPRDFIAKVINECTEELKPLKP